MIAYRDLSPDVPMVVNAKPREVYSDGIATIEKLGDNFRTTYFTWGKMPGSELMVRVPVVRITRPIASVLGVTGGFGLGSGILNAMKASFVRH